jgi:uncharacterized protein (UPF0335 family)
VADVVAADELRVVVERIERLSEERQGIADDIKDVYGEAKSRGYCVKTIRKVVARRKMDRDAAQEQDAIFATYCHALGMQLAFDL